MQIILTLILIAARLFALVVLLYFGMLIYFAYKDGTIYQYHNFKCEDQVFINEESLKLYEYSDSNVIKLEIDMGTTKKDIFPIGNKFKILSLYSLYDFEGGTFYTYLVEDKKGIKSLISFNDIDPLTCTWDTDNKYRSQNIQNYYPNGEKTKISKSTRNKVFDSNKGKL